MSGTRQGGGGVVAASTAVLPGRWGGPVAAPPLFNVPADVSFLFNPYPASQPPSCHSGVTDQHLAILITVERFWKPSLINAVLPVVLVFTLGLMTFFTSECSGSTP